MDTPRPATPDDAAICGRICYDAFCTINDEHQFPHDFPSVEVATGLLRMMIDHPDSRRGRRLSCSSRVLLPTAVSVLSLRLSRP